MYIAEMLAVSPESGGPFSFGAKYQRWAEAGKGFANKRWIFDPWRPVSWIEQGETREIIEAYAGVSCKEAMKKN